MKSLNEAMKNLQKSKTIKENNLFKSKKLLKTESNFDKAQATLPLDNYHAMGIIVSENGETVQYMYSDEDTVYESEIQYDVDGRPFFNDEEGVTWYIDEFMRTDYPKLREDKDTINESTKESQNEYDYMLLDRLRQDCEYFLGNGNRSEKHLWAGNVNDQIAKMKELYNKLPEKPEWLSMEDIENYEKEMKQDEKTELNESLEMDEAIKTGVLNYLDEYNTENLMDYGSDEDVIGGMNSISKMFEDILRDILKINFVNVSTVDGISDGKYVTTIDFGDKTLDLDIRASEEKDDILEDVKTIIDFYNKDIENLTEDADITVPTENDTEFYKNTYSKTFNTWKKYNPQLSDEEIVRTIKALQYNGDLHETPNENKEVKTEDIGTMTPDEYVLKETKKALLDRGLDIDLLHETCSEFDLTNQLRTIIHNILYGINFNVNEYIYGEDFDFSLDNKLNLTIDMIEDLDEAKKVENEIRGITPAERKILNAVKVVNSKYDLSNIKIETTRKGNTHIMSTKGEDIVTIGPLTDDEKEELRLNGYYM